MSSPENFRALVVREKDDGTFVSAIEQRSLKDLPDGEVLVKVHYSSVNYKDALSASGNKGVTRSYPHTPGIDAAGIVVTSDNANYSPGTEVIVMGYDLGMNTAGAYGEYIRVPANWIIRKPTAISFEDAMSLGTAGFTAAMCVDSLIQVGVDPSQGMILVTGATGGVATVAIKLLDKLGYKICACTSSQSEYAWLRAIGAQSVLDTKQFIAEGGAKPLLKEQWAGVIDTVGGDVLSTAIASTKYGGSIACCGMVGGAKLNTSVYPFILRSVNLLGVDSVELPLETKEYMWRQLSADWSFPLDEIVSQVSLEQLPGALQSLLENHHKGRIVLKHGK